MVEKKGLPTISWILTVLAVGALLLAGLWPASSSRAPAAARAAAGDGQWAAW